MAAHTTEQDPIPSGYWFAMVVFVLAFPVFFTLVAITALIGIPSQSFVYAVIALLFFLMGPVAGIASLYGYYTEAKQLRAVESEWVPRWGLYALGQVVLLGPIAALVYLIQRRRHIGIPWQDAPPVGSWV